MSRRILTFAALTLAVIPLPATWAQETPGAPTTEAPAITTATSQDFPQVSCTSSDALACTDTLELASDTHDQLASLLKLDPGWRFAVHIHIMAAGDPLLEKINREAAAVFAQGNTMKLEAVVPSTDPNAREFIQRQFVTVLLWEKFFANTTTFDKTTKLDAVPFWLIEGLRGWLNDDPDHGRESIVRRAVHSQSTPTLDEVTNWHELSDDRLLGLWQRAFTFYLVDSITEPGPKRADFQQWLEGMSGPNASTAQYHFPTENDWQRELVDASTRSRDKVYTWEETMEELKNAETLTFAPTKDAPIQTCPIYDVADKPHSTMMFEAIQERIYLLTELHIRSHPSWSPIIQTESDALTLLIRDNQVDKSKQLLQTAKRQIADEIAFHQKLLDYMNWFEVTKDYAGNTSHFDTYFSTAKEMEQVEADPTHPNPIRANLLQIESEL